MLARSAMIFCGNAEMSWQELESALHYLADHESRHGRSVWTNYSVIRKHILSLRLGKMFLDHADSRPSTSSAWSWISNIRKGWNIFVRATDEPMMNATNYSFHDFIATDAGNNMLRLIPSAMMARCTYALFSMRTREATNLRDKIYGIYGFLHKQGVTKLPPVDYDASIEEVYTTMARFAIENDRSLLCLVAVLGPECLPGLPSWVPDWSNNYPSFPIGGTGFAAAQSYPARFSFDDLTHLTLYGVVIDKICDVAHQSTLTSYEMRDETFIALEKSTANLLSAIQLVSAYQEWIKLARTFQSYPTGEPVEDALCRTLICNGRGIIREELEETSVMFRSFREWIVMIMANNPGEGVGIPFLCATMETWSNTQTVKQYHERDLGLDTNPETAPEEVTIIRAIQSSDACHFHALAGTYSAQRIFSTTRGGRFGLVPLGVRPGDDVVLVSGSDVPFIVRREGPTWRLLGAAYVHGVMLGEAWPRNARLDNFTFS